MKHKVFQKYEILRKIYENQYILQKYCTGITIAQLRRELRKGNLKEIYNNIWNIIQSGLLTKVGGRGYTTEVIINSAGVKRIKWLETQQRH